MSKRITVLLGLSICTAGLLLTNCGGSAGSTPPQDPIVNKQKSPIHGLVAMGKIPNSFMSSSSVPPVNDFSEATTHPNVYVASNLNVGWDQIQPNGSTDFVTTAIDDALKLIDTYNSTHSPQMKVKLRIFAGVHAPQWVKSATGTVSLLATDDSYPDFPKFWTTTYGNYWRNLQTLLAQRYDNDSHIAEVGVSSCVTSTDEPFIMPQDTTSRANLLLAGYSDAQRHTCLTNAATVDYSPWVNTPLDLTFNPLSDIDSGQIVTNYDFTFATMALFRQTYGKARGVIANHGLQNPLKPVVQPLYDGTGTQSGFRQLGSPLAFQTISQTPNGGWQGTVEYGRSYGATELEIWVTKDAGGLADISYSTLQTWAAYNW